MHRVVDEDYDSSRKREYYEEIVDNVVVTDTSIDMKLFIYQRYHEETFQFLAQEVMQDLKKLPQILIRPLCCHCEHNILIIMMEMDKVEENPLLEISEVPFMEVSLKKISLPKKNNQI